MKNDLEDKTQQTRVLQARVEEAKRRKIDVVQLMLDEKLQTINLIENLKNKLNYELKHGFCDNIDSDNFQAQQQERDQVVAKKKQILQFLESLETQLIKIKMQVIHQSKLNSGELKEQDVVTDAKSGLKKVTTLKNEELLVESKGTIQDSIDQYRKLAFSNLANIEQY